MAFGWLMLELILRTVPRTRVKGKSQSVPSPSVELAGETPQEEMGEWTAQSAAEGAGEQGVEGGQALLACVSAHPESGFVAKPGRTPTCAVPGISVPSAERLTLKLSSAVASIGWHLGRIPTPRLSRLSGLAVLSAQE
eukprot:scaffold174029_cov36-Tisochrysis_lutea.AAC.3